MKFSDSSKTMQPASRESDIWSHYWLATRLRFLTHILLLCFSSRMHSQFPGSRAQGRHCAHISSHTPGLSLVQFLFYFLVFVVVACFGDRVKLIHTSAWKPMLATPSNRSSEDHLITWHWLWKRSWYYRICTCYQWGLFIFSSKELTCQYNR